MYKLVAIDLMGADIVRFEDYERKVIPLICKYGGRLELGVRSVDDMSETHVLYFPDVSCFEGFLSDPIRTALQDDWQLAGAKTTITDVNAIGYLL